MLEESHFCLTIQEELRCGAAFTLPWLYPHESEECGANQVYPVGRVALLHATLKPEATICQRHEVKGLR